jgi:DNA-binding PadR family transcriptional regulator
VDKHKVPLLGYALLGLLYQKESSGYELRKFFASTPMGVFSDSPGSIYPALQRLEKQGFIRAKIEEGAGLRRRRMFRPTPAGRAEFKRWLSQPVTHDAIMRRIPELFLRFAFLDEVLGPSSTLKFLRQFESGLRGFIPELQKHLETSRKAMSLSGRLALENGIRVFEANLQWAIGAIKTYEQEAK